MQLRSMSMTEYSYLKKSREKPKRQQKEKTLREVPASSACRRLIELEKNDECRQQCCTCQ